MSEKRNQIQHIIATVFQLNWLKPENRENKFLAKKKQMTLKGSEKEVKLL